MNTITIELCKEDRQRLDVISDTLELIRLALTTAGAPFPAAPVAVPDAPAVEAKEMPTPEPEPATAPQDAPAEAPAAKPVERSAIQRKVVELSAADKKTEVRDIVTAYAKNVSGIPEDKLAEVWAKLTALEG